MSTRVVLAGPEDPEDLTPVADSVPLPVAAPPPPAPPCCECGHGGREGSWVPDWDAGGQAWLCFACAPPVRAGDGGA